MKYEIVKDDLRNQDTLVRTNDDGTITYIPCNEANSDYQAYLNPVEHLTESVTKAK